LSIAADLNEVLLMSAQRAETGAEKVSEWIVDQVLSGQPVPALLESMCSAGWDRDLATTLIEQSLQAHLAASAEEAVPQSVQVPRPDIADSPMYLDLGDRKVSLLLVIGNPNIVMLGNFLSDEECDALIACAGPRMQRSLTADMSTGGEKLDVVRTSDGMFFQRGENALVAAIEARIANLLDWPVEKGEGLQVLHYGPGNEYEPHYDYFDPAEPGTAVIVARGGQRVATVLMYLAEPERGGETVFPDIGLRVAPKRGCALFFSYDRPHPSTKTRHGGAPVIAGEKWVATKWLREDVFD
jgi:prolyl 4-hydroxylase